MLAALIMFSGCAQKLGNNGALPDKADSSAAFDTLGGADDTGERPSGYIELIPSENVGKISVLVSDRSLFDHNAAAELFREMGGELSLSFCAEDMLIDSISEKKLADSRVDIASFDNGLMYPYGVSKGMLEPIDTVLDLNSSRYNNIGLASDLFNIGGLHYVFPFNVSAAYALYYDPEKVMSVTGIDPAESAANGEWTVALLEQMLKEWYEYTDEDEQDEEPAHAAGLAGEYGMPMFLSTGKTLIGYDKGSSGFFNNSFDKELARVADMLYSFKQQGYICETDFLSVEEALGAGAMFYAVGFAKSQTPDSETNLRAVPFPTEDGTVRFFQARIDGAVLVNGLKYTDSARAFLECALKSASPPEGDFAEAFVPPNSARPVYPYGCGLSPKLSLDASKPDDGFPHAVIPLMYSAPYYTGTWESVCSYFAKPLTTELSRLNNNIAPRINP